MVSGQLNPVSWVRVRVKVRVRVRIRVEVKVMVRVPNLNPNWRYMTGVSVLEPVGIDTLLCRSVTTANLRPHSEF